MKKQLLLFILAINIFPCILFVLSCKKDNSNNNTTVTVVNQFTDPRDKKVYNTVVIGTQTWMAQNLDYDTAAGSYMYNNSSSVESTYGRLYNWNVAQLVCPPGWHLPDTAEWNTLINYLTGYFAAGGKMKETGFLHWNSPNTGASNSSGFDAIPGGDWNTSVYQNIGNYAYYWSSTIADSAHAYCFFIENSSMDIFKNPSLKTYAYSIRCVKN
jgi:uncharacterized protein (TIGR02145 family)